MFGELRWSTHWRYKHFLYGHGASTLFSRLFPGCKQRGYVKLRCFKQCLGGDLCSLRYK
jgi:hypothetical protein